MVYYLLNWIRNDGMEDRYSVLVELKNQMTADGFYHTLNGKKYSPGEAELCHILFLLSVDYTDSDEIAVTPPEGCIELPTCPVCLEGHAVKHWKDTQHCYSLELNRQQIWDYVGDAYVHRLNQSKIDGKLITDLDSQCMSVEGDCDRCECSDDSGISGALYSSKVETIVDEYNRLLASQLETQRQYYETLLMEAKTKKESSMLEAVEKLSTVISSRPRNRGGKLKEIEEREAASLRLREERILDLEEQIRDLTVYIEAQKTLKDMTDSDGIKGGTLLPVPSSKQSSPANSRRQTKFGRRRN
ncbi:zinc finger ubiquitin-hydrolase domain-containing protein [Prunus dulcis]|uniref:Zinc finger ubiquitin-hydrolase domain-containing protein n=1 Tax=Prunus dulcis TaxID=3755 RepID=A0A4Y1RXB5_PRUDU|nr:zinc finger ubiquitin-hydrolase domain-containing protein [Prunus dulcis]